MNDWFTLATAFVGAIIGSIAAINAGRLWRKRRDDDYGNHAGRGGARSRG